MTSILVLFMLVGATLTVASPLYKGKKINDRPIIGILAQEIHDPLMSVLEAIPSTPEEVSIRTLQQTLDHETSQQEHIVEEEANPELRIDLNELTPTYEIVSSETPFSNGGIETQAETGTTAFPNTSRSRRSAVHTAHRRLRYDVNSSYIDANYVKFIESAGARVVPIMINQDRAYYQDLMSSINGVLFPGGGVPVDETSGYGRAGKVIYEIAKEMNDAGEVFPLWGTCLGFELLMSLAAGGKDPRTPCDAQNTLDRLKLDPGYDEGRLLRHLPKALLKALISEPLAANFHHLCVTPQNFTKFGVDSTFRPIAYNCDRRGVEYVAAVEGKHYPFFALQFHPEKSPFEWTTMDGHNHIAHSRESIEIASYFAQFFVRNARRSQHKFSNETEETENLIYNFSPIYTGTKTYMTQAYFF